MGFAIGTVAVIFCIGNLPVTNQFGLEFELAVFHRVVRGINEVHDADTNAGAQGFNRRRHQMNRFVRIANVRQIHHRGERFGVVNVRHTTTVFIAGGAAVGLAVAVEVKEVHPQANFRGAPSAHQRVTESGTARRGMEGVSLGGVDGMGDISHITDSKAGFPITPVHEGSAKAWVVGVFPGPCLNRHVVNVNPAAHRGLPRHFVLADLHDGMAEAGCWNVREVASGRAHEVEVGNRHATASFPDGVVAVVVVGVGHEHVPLTINHVRVEVMWAGGVIGIVP